MQKMSYFIHITSLFPLNGSEIYCAIPAPAIYTIIGNANTARQIIIDVVWLLHFEDISKTIQLRIIRIIVLYVRRIAI